MKTATKVAKPEKQEIRYFVDKITIEKARQLAETHKEKAFGILHGIAKKLGKKAEIKAVGMIKRYEPFWHIIASFLTEYERKSKYKIYVDPVVKALEIGKDKFKIAEKQRKQNIVIVDATDICEIGKKKEMLVDATIEARKPEDIKHNSKFEKYLQCESKKIKEIETLVSKRTQVLDVRLKASFLVRSILQAIIYPVDADKILKEELSIEKLVLYFRPVYIFEYISYPKGDKRFIFVDALTEEVGFAKKLEKKKTSTSFTESTLFEIGGEAISTLIPGGEAAFKLFMHLKEYRKKKKFRA